MDTAIPCVSVASLRSALGSPDAPLIIDVRRAQAYEADAFTIAGALRRSPETSQEWSGAIAQSKQIVVACVHGHEVSQGVVQVLLEAGFEAAYLEGGMQAWVTACAPMIRKQPELNIPGQANSRWITRERPKIDRIACPWLIRSFIDPLAEFLYVPADDVKDMAVRCNAIPYDVPEVRFSHRGKQCSFDALIEDFGLRDAVLDELAVIVRGADTGRPELSPQSPGLLAISLGLSVNYKDDHAMLEQGMVIYHSLYAWLSQARGEIHNAKLFEKL